MSALYYVYAGPRYGRLHELLETRGRELHVRAVAGPQHSLWVHQSDCELAPADLQPSSQSSVLSTQS